MEQSIQKKFSFSNYLVALVLGFFGIGALRLVFLPITLFLFLQLNQTMSQPYGGIITSDLSMLLITPVMVFVQIRYRSKLTSAHIFGIWTGWAIQLILPVITLFVKFN